MSKDQIAKAAQSITALGSLADAERANYAMHMDHVRRGSDPDLRDAHLRAASRAYEGLQRALEAIDRLFDQVRT
jgi:hypothetical protein